MISEQHRPVLLRMSITVKVKQFLDRPWGFQEVQASRFQDNRYWKVVRLSNLCTGRLYPKEIFLILIPESTPGP